MPQVLLMVKPDVIQGRDLEALGQILITGVERTWPETKGDVTFSILFLACTIGEADVQVEVRYTAGGEEYIEGEVFDPSYERKGQLVDALLLGLRSMLPPNTSFTVWVMPVKESVFRFGE